MYSEQTPISIIIPTFNRSRLLDYTLHSITRQTVGVHLLDVIVVDDGSTDDTRKVLRRYENKLNLRCFYQEDKGYRVATARNTGIQHARGQTLVFVDSGMLLASWCIEAHQQMHKAGKDPVAVVGYVYCFDQHDHNCTLDTALVNTVHPDETIGYFKRINQHLDIRETSYQKYRDNLAALPAPWVFFWTCNVSVNKESLLKMGAFDESFNNAWGSEDVELAYRLHQGQVKIVLNRHAEAIHYPHPKNLEEMFREEVKNKQYFHKKYNSPHTEMFLGCDSLTLNDRIIRQLTAQPVLDPVGQ